MPDVMPDLAPPSAPAEAASAPATPDQDDNKEIVKRWCRIKHHPLAKSRPLQDAGKLLYRFPKKDALCLLVAEALDHRHAS